MAHTYASLDQFKNFLTGNGASDYGTTEDAAMLAIVEGASRRVDSYTMRSRFGSGFGPRIATNTYDHDGASTLELHDDFITVTAVTSAPTTGDAGVAMVSGSDYLLAPATTPGRRLIFIGLGSVAVGVGYQVFTVAGTAGYGVETETVGAIGTATAGTTSISLTSGSAYPGTTLLVDSEQMYVTASTGGTALTVVRGVNGTTAAVHAASAAASRYRYDRRVESATLLVAQRRWRMREAGVTGDFGGGSVPGVVHRDSEMSILRSTVGDLKVYGAA